MAHIDATLTPRTRLRLARRIVDDHWTYSLDSQGTETCNLSGGTWTGANTGSSYLSVGVLVVDRPQLLRAAPRDVDVSFVSGELLLETVLLPVGETLPGGAQDVSDSIRRIVLAATMTVDLLLDPAADISNRGSTEFHYVEGVEDSGGVIQLISDGVLVAVGGVEGGDLDPGTRLPAA